VLKMVIDIDIDVVPFAIDT